MTGKNPCDDFVLALHDGREKFLRAVHVTKCRKSVLKELLQFPQAGKFRRAAQQFEGGVNEGLADRCVESFTYLINQLYLV